MGRGRDPHPGGSLGHSAQTWQFIADGRISRTCSRAVSAHFGRAHLLGMETNNDTLETVLTLSELAARLRVRVQTIHDLPSHGRVPRGFRVGRELRFRASERVLAGEDRGSRLCPPSSWSSVMVGGRPRTAIGTYGGIRVMRRA